MLYLNLTVINRPYCRCENALIATTYRSILTSYKQKFITLPVFGLNDLTDRCKTRFNRDLIHEYTVTKLLILHNHKANN